MNKNEFKVGDKVYCLTLGVGVYTIQPHHNMEYPLKISNGNEERTFNPEGRLWEDDILQSLYHATEENRAALEQLHGVAFEAPAITGSARTRQLLEQRPNTPVLCVVAHRDEKTAIERMNIRLVGSITCNGSFRISSGATYPYAIPLDEVLPHGTYSIGADHE